MKKLKQKAVGYLRISGQKQASGYGFDRQRETIENFCKEKGFEIIKYNEEIFTGTEADRPIFNEMIADILSNDCRIIVVESMDRFCRDLSVQLYLLVLLKSHGLILWSASTAQNIIEERESDPMLKALVTIQAVFAELDKDLTVRRLQKARELKRIRTGHCEGRRRYGFYEGEQEILKRIKQLYRKPRGGKRLSYFKIAKRLNREEIPSRSGKAWTDTSVKRILQRETSIK